LEPLSPYQKEGHFGFTLERIGYLRAAAGRNLLKKCVILGRYTFEGVTAFVIVLAGLVGRTEIAYCEPPVSVNENSFLPTWKLLTPGDRKQFIAGYMYGWRDAAKVTDAAIDFVKQNPKDAVEGLTKVRSLYEMDGVRTDALVHELELFFEKSENRESTLSQAVTAVRFRMKK
jgi:hypothetical protein